MRALRLFATGWLPALLTALLLAGLLGTPAPAQAASYNFPTAMPAGCSGSNGSYTCNGGFLGYGDTVAISGTKPATVTVNGDLSLDNVRINQAGSASDLTLVVRGLLTPGYQTVIQGHVTVYSVSDGNGEVQFGGNLRATQGDVQLGYRTTVAGSINADQGQVVLADEVTVQGNITADRDIITGQGCSITGSITTPDAITIGQETTVVGAVTSSDNKDIVLAYGSRVMGNVTAADGTIDIAQNAVTRACVRVSSGSRPIKLGYQAQAAAVCCGTVGSCRSGCVENSSTTAMPPLCTALGSDAGLTGEYFSNRALTAPASLTRVDGTVAFLWGAGSPAVGLPADNFSVRWTGFVRVPTTGSYRFQTESNDGVRLWVNGSQLINNWTEHWDKLDQSAAVSLTAGVSYPLVMEFFEGVGTATAGLYWLRPGSSSYALIPAGTTSGGGLFVTGSAQSGPHRLDIQHASGTGLTCTPSMVTVRACANADCSTLYTSGVSGNLAATGGSVVWPSGTSFSIPSGSSSTTVSLQATTTTATVLGVASSSPAASQAASCNFGSPGCTFTAADAGFIFDVPHHVSETSQTVNLSAVRKSDNSASCTPAFASSSKAVTFSCGYTNPTSGSLPVRVGNVALNSGNSSSTACDSGGRAVTLAFNAGGVASTTVLYADAGQMLLSARYAGAAGSSEAGLVMTGSDSFIAAPDHFSIDAITAGPIRAGNNFSATVTARNALGNTTPNHGRETTAQRAAIGWVKRLPNGTGSVPGSFSGTGVRSFTNGAVTASDLAWTEVGRGDLVVRGSDNAGYLGSGLHVFGSSLASGARSCAAEGANCVLPGGTTATVYYGAPGGWTAQGGQTGTVACTNGMFGDPISGTAKRCYYAAAASSDGSVGDVIPHRFSVAASNACGAFSYAGQAMAATVTAQNAAGTTTRNFNGTATTTPGFAQAVTLADASNLGLGLGLGTLAGASIAASAFSAGVASATPSYSFTAKTTAPQSLVLRASNGGSGSALISSAGFAEPTSPLRSGRLRLANAFGKATAALLMPVVAEYWGGSAWQINTADNCTALASASVALGNPRGAGGAASTASTSAGAVAISSGSGSISLAAPSPAGSSLSLDLAINLGSTGTDQSCNSAHPATTGAGLPWLRALNGSCATTADRDPAARASFGIFAPETRKTVHARDLY